MLSDTTLYFVKLYWVIVLAICFSSICRTIFRLIFGQVELIASIISCTLQLSKDQP